MARVVVLGGTGYAGAHIVAEAAARGHDVVCSCPVSEFGQSVNTVGAASVFRPSSLECAA